MSTLSRRNFLKQLTAAGAGAALFPSILSAGEKQTSSSGTHPLLLVSPCLVKPTLSEITVNIVAGDKPLDCFINYREAGGKTVSWQKTENFSVNAYTPVNIPLKHLNPDTLYEYQVNAGIKGFKSYRPFIKSTFRLFPVRFNKGYRQFIIVNIHPGIT